MTFNIKQMKLQIIKWIGLMICLFLSVRSDAQYYAKGRYYDLAGNKTIGLIKLYPDEDRLLYKADEKAPKVKVKIKDISAVIIEHSLTEPDSLIVMTEDNKPNKQYFARLVAVSPVRSFYLKYHSVHVGGVPSMTSMTTQSAATGAYTTTNRWTSGGSRSFAGEEAQAMYQEDNTTYELTRSNFIQILSEAFTDQPQLAQEIKDKKYKFKSAIALLERYQAGRPVKR